MLYQPESGDSLVSEDLSEISSVASLYNGESPRAVARRESVRRLSTVQRLETFGKEKLELPSGTKKPGLVVNNSNSTS